MTQNKINKKLLPLSILIILAISLSLFATTSAIPTSTTLTLKSGSTTLTLTASDILALPSYSGIGAVRSGGSINPSSIGTYTGVPLLTLCNLVGGIQSSSYIKITASDGYSTMLSYDQVHNNNFVQYDITTNTIITNQNPLIIVAYSFNGADLTYDAGGPLRDIVVSEQGMATYGNVMVKYIASIEIINPPTNALNWKTTDSLGNAKSTFNQGENVYFTATGLSASSQYPVYVVEDATSWTTRTTLPTRVTGTETTLSTDSSGNIAATSIFSNAVPGTYDVVVDVNSNGKYDEADLLINNVVTTSGFFVVPEYTLGALIALVACFAAFITVKSGTLNRISPRKLF